MASIAYRGYKWTNIDFIAAPTGGWNTDTVPWLLPVTQAPVLDNFIVRTGNIQGRGGLVGLNVPAINTVRSPPGAGGNLPVGFIPNVTLGEIAATSVGANPWDCAAIGLRSGNFMYPTTSLAWFTADGSTPPAVTTVTQGIAPGPRWINWQGTLYGLGLVGASDTTTVFASDAGSSYAMSRPNILKNPAQQGQPGIGQSKLTPGTTSNISYASSGPSTWTFSGTTAVSSPVPVNGATTGAAFTNFGFTIPATATIVGIGAGFNRLNGLPASFTDFDVDLVISGAASGLANKATNFTWVSTPGGSTMTYGSGSDTWGNALTPAIVNSSGFGIMFGAKNTAGTGSGTATIQFLGLTVVYSIPPGTPAAPTIASANWPVGSVDITSYLNRMWVAQGIDIPAGATVHEPTSIFYTNPISPTATFAFTAADWQSSGVTNKFTIDNDHTNPIMGFGRITNALVLFRRKSISVLRGTSSTNFAITTLSSQVGCLDPRSIVETDAGVYFVSNQGLMLTNGSKIVNSSGGVALSMMRAIQTEQNAVASATGGSSGWITAGVMSQGQILLTIGVMGAAAIAMPTLPSQTQQLGGSQMRTVWSGLYDPATNSWTRVTSWLFGLDNGSVTLNATTPFNLSGVPDMPQIVTPVRMIGNRAIGTIGAAGMLVRWEDQNFGYTFLDHTDYGDYAPITNPGAGTTNVPTWFAIPFRWQTKFNAIVGTASSTRKYGAAIRYFLDHVFASDNTAAQGWVVEPIDSTGTAVDTLAQPAIMTTTVTSLGLVADPSTGSVIGDTPQQHLITRDNQDFNYEISDLSYMLTVPYFSGTNIPATVTRNPGNYVAEIYGLGTEYQGSRDLRDKS